MLNLALWLKANGFRPDQVQAFLPSPMASATAMYHTGFNPLKPLRDPKTVEVAKGLSRRRLHKAFLRITTPTTGPFYARPWSAWDAQSSSAMANLISFPPGNPKAPVCSTRVVVADPDASGAVVHSRSIRDCRRGRRSVLALDPSFALENICATCTQGASMFGEQPASGVVLLGCCLLT